MAGLQYRICLNICVNENYICPHCGVSMNEKKNGNILVIDDNRMNVNLLRVVLEVKGNYTVHEAVNAEDGIEKAYKYHPDVILMDIQMPGMDGLSATRVIKLDSNLKDIPIIAVSANTRDETEQQALSAGCSGYITKPIDVRNFVDTMEQFL